MKLKGLSKNDVISFIDLNRKLATKAILLSKSQQPFGHFVCFLGAKNEQFIQYASGKDCKC